MSTLTYKQAGVDINAGDALVEKIKHIAKKTTRPGVMSSIGGFSSLFAIPLDKYKKPLLVSSTDGVGTKLKLAIDTNQHSTIGIDLVAMCVNDIIVTGAEPLYFLDYYATGKLDVETAHTIIAGIGEGCLQSNMALVGGETAEMPGMYHGQDYDLAGFCVGIVEQDKVLDGQSIQPGDVLIALASSGVHSNGYSLVRKVLDTHQVDINNALLNNQKLSDILLAPTKIYVKSLLPLIEQQKIKSLAHITGGGIIENLPRVLPNGVQANIHIQSWKRPAIFDYLQTLGNIPEDDMWRTFNCGVGMIACVAKEDVPSVLKALTNASETAWVIGDITAAISNQIPAQVILVP